MKKNYLIRAREVMVQEANGIKAIIEELDETFNQLVMEVLNCNGRVVLTGVGKSGIIARKISATLSSTGTPSFFMHPAEAAHGDLGMVTCNDVVILLSNSGETDELLKILPSLKRIGCKIASFTSRLCSTLAKAADIVIVFPLLKEADRNMLAPTVSTTMMLSVGDALAMVLLDERNFDRNNFALYHPSGALGRKLIIKVKDIMKSNNDIPLITKNANIEQAILEISKKGWGATIVVNEEGSNKIIGIITDGDIRRLVKENERVWAFNVENVMTQNPSLIKEHVLAVEALNLMERKKITFLPVINENEELTGILHMHHILQAGVI